MRKTICILLFLTLTVSGCAPLVFFGVGTAAGVAGYKYYEGALRVIYQAPYEKTWAAAVEALDKMDIKIEDRNKELTSGKLTALLADGKTLTITLKYQSPQETEAVIRVGLLGDENTSLAIKDEIRKALFK